MLEIHLADTPPRIRGYFLRRRKDAAFPEMVWVDPHADHLICETSDILEHVVDDIKHWLWSTEPIVLHDPTGKAKSGKAKSAKCSGCGGTIQRTHTCEDYVVWHCNSCRNAELEHFSELDEPGWQWLRAEYASHAR